MKAKAITKTCSASFSLEINYKIKANVRGDFFTIIRDFILYFFGINQFYEYFLITLMHLCSIL